MSSNQAGVMSDILRKIKSSVAFEDLNNSYFQCTHVTFLQTEYIFEEFVQRGSYWNDLQVLS